MLLNIEIFIFLAAKSGCHVIPVTPPPHLIHAPLGYAMGKLWEVPGLT